ncbi:MAG: VanZ family protein [Oscillospiraceae bacterium]|jgi:VanZ family protein|nr:VanZ family protein [Oscillospiraceae bacterium]
MKHKQRGALGAVFSVLAVALVGGVIWFIWSNSLLSGMESGLRSQAVAEALGRLFRWLLGENSSFARYIVQNVRKVAHAVEFAALGAAAVLLLAALRRVNAHMLLHAIGAVLAVAVADEAIQIFTGRGAMVQDVLLDFAGGMVGLLAMLLLRALFRALFRR